MDDYITCGLCSCQFYLSNYQDFLNHKISKCSNTDGYIFKSASDYSCVNCDISTKNADEFIQHYEIKHQMKLNKRKCVDTAIQVEEFEAIDFNMCNMEDNKIILKAKSAVLDVELDKENIKRDRCCLEEANSDYCGEIAQCPLLFDANLISPATSRDTCINNTDDSLQSNSIVNLFPLHKYKFSCSFCNKRFKQKVHLSKHILVKHENSRPYKCSLCNYRTVEKGYLKTHMRKHTGERPYSCMVCDYQSSQNCALKVHMKRLHPDFTLDCRFCGGRFRTSLELGKHEQVCQSRLG